MTQDTLAHTFAEQAWADRIAQPLQQPVYTLLERLPALRTFLNGTWMGHPVHAAVTDVPVGAWAAGAVFDLLDSLGVRRDLRQASDAVQTVGLAAALGAAVFGLADWSYTGDKARRIGLIHGLTNVGIAGLYGLSLLARRRGQRAVGTTLSGVGFGLLLFSGWLGGELSYRYGVGVNRRAFEEEPGEWTDVLDEREVREGQLYRADAAGTPVLVTRFQGQFYAIGDTCTHMGCSLSEGRLEGDAVACPCHDSHFRVTDGQVVRGPATVSEPAYAVRVRDGRIEVRRVDAAQPAAA